MTKTSTTDLVIGGMTCASCAARVERKLNRLGGVTATVNFATEAARVSFPGTLTVGDLIAAVERTGYTAALPAPPDAGRDADAAASSRRELRLRMLVSVTLAVPVVLLAMVPALQFPDWRWASLAAATPVATWGAWPFHRAALISARHGAATMDTLVSLGVSAAYLWSLYALFLAGGGTHATYLEVASGVTALILLGRYLEARAKRAPARRCAPCLTWAPSRRRCSGTDASSAFRPTSSGWTTISSSGRGRRSRPTAPSSGAARRWTRRC